MRVISAGRLTTISILLIVIGTSPRIVAFLAEHLPRAAEGWSERLSRPLFDQLAAAWGIVAAKLYLASIAGAVLFVGGTGWALVMRIYRMFWHKNGEADDPIRISKVLLREAELIDGRN
jgi:hypothetical protein